MSTSYDPWAPKTPAERRLQREALTYCLTMYLLMGVGGLFLGWFLFR